MNILITGGAGFIGSHLADRLVADGHSACVIDNLSTGSLENIKHHEQNGHFRYYIDTIMNEALIDELVAKADHIYHLAAAVGVKLIMDRPIETLETNVKGSEIVLRAANKYKKKILIASTSEIYGNHVEHTLKEDDNRVMGSIRKRRWAYACSKTLDEFLALAYFIEKKLPVVVTRFFNTVGPRQTGAYGMVLPSFVQSALLDKPITVYGDGSQTRSFTYVADVVDAIVKLMDHPEAVGEAFNIGSAEEISIKGLAEKVKQITESKSEIIYVPYEKAYGMGFEDMKRRTPDITKIQQMIDYKPSLNLDAIIEKVVEYFKK